jgi:hypothetical protein
VAFTERVISALDALDVSLADFQQEVLKRNAEGAQESSSASAVLSAGGAVGGGGGSHNSKSDGGKRVVGGGGGLVAGAKPQTAVSALTWTKEAQVCGWAWC